MSYDSMRGEWGQVSSSGVSVKWRRQRGLFGDRAFVFWRGDFGVTRLQSLLV